MIEYIAVSLGGGCLFLFVLFLFWHSEQQSAQAYFFNQHGDAIDWPKLAGRSGWFLATLIQLESNRIVTARTPREIEAANRVGARINDKLLCTCTRCRAHFRKHAQTKAFADAAIALEEAEQEARDAARREGPRVDVLEFKRERA